MRRFWELGGFVAGAVLVVFGAVAIYMGVTGFNTVSDSLKDEQITFGTTDDPAVAAHAAQYAGQQVANGDQARAFALVMRTHTLEATNGLTYSQMGRYKATTAKGGDGLGGTNDTAKAVTDPVTGQPVSNSRRYLWVTETALTTALNMSYMAEQLSIFGMVVGIALLLTGIGLLVVTFAVFAREPESEKARKIAPRPATG